MLRAALVLVGGREWGSPGTQTLWQAWRMESLVREVSQGTLKLGT